MQNYTVKCVYLSFRLKYTYGDGANDSRLVPAKSLLIDLHSNLVKRTNDSWIIAVSPLKYLYISFEFFYGCHIKYSPYESRLKAGTYVPGSMTQHLWHAFPSSCYIYELQPKCHRTSGSQWPGHIVPLAAFARLTNLNVFSLELSHRCKHPKLPHVSKL